MHSAAIDSSFRIVRTSKVIAQLLTRGTRIAADLTQLAAQLCALAEQAYNRRDLDTVKEAAAILASLPDPRAQSAGLWFQSIADKREGKLELAHSTLARLIEDAQAAPRFRARAFQTLGTIYHERGELERASELYSESACFIRRETPRDLFTQMQGLTLLSAALINKGEPLAALRTLAQVEPIIHTIGDPLQTAIYCNNVAVALAGVKRIDEARQYSRLALASPYAEHYSEWLETAAEIEQAKSADLNPQFIAQPLPVAAPVKSKCHYIMTFARLICPDVGTLENEIISVSSDRKPTNPITFRLARSNPIRAPACFYL